MRPCIFLLRTTCWLKIISDSVTCCEQEAQLSQRGRAMLGGSEYFTKPLKVTENGTIRKLGTVFHSRCIATMAVSFAVSTQYTNVTDRQTPHDGTIGRAYAQHRAAKKCNCPSTWTDIQCVLTLFSVHQGRTVKIYAIFRPYAM